MKHRFLSCLLILALMLTLVPMSVFADEQPLSWGAENGVLTVSGTAIPDYTAESPAPWTIETEEYKPADVTKIIVSEGTVSLGENAFAGMENVTELTLPATLTELGANAIPASMQGAQANFASETVTFGAEAITLAPTAPVSDRDGYTAAWAGFTLSQSAPVTVDKQYVPIVYYATFKNGEEEVGKVEFTVETTALAAPAVPEKAGYTGAWEAYTLGASDITVNAVYSLATYTVTFTADGTVVATDTYTIDDATVTAPAVPAKTGYTGAWETYTLGASDLTVKAVYTPTTYYATFVAEGKTVSSVPFTVETAKLAEPAVPAKAGFNGAWKAYTLGTRDITVEAVYTFATYSGTVTASCLNVRSSASTSATRTNKLAYGATITIVAEQTDSTGMKWGQLSSGGWVSLTYVKKIASTGGSGSGNSGTATATTYTATVSASSLNVRSGPGTNYGVQSGLKKGAVVTFTEQKTASNGTVWCKLSTGGWVSKAYLSNIKAVTTSGGNTSGGNTSGGNTSSGNTSSGNTSGGSTPDNPAAGFRSYTATVSVSSRLNVRSGAGTNHSVVSSLTNGAKVTVTAETVSAGTTWAKVSTGWVSKAYLKNIQYIDSAGSSGSTTPDSGSSGSSGTTTPDSGSSGTTTTGTTYMVTASSLNVRSGPGTSYSKVASLAYGTIVTVTERSSNWGKTSKGWISMDYVLAYTPPVHVEGNFRYTLATYTTNCASSSSNRKTNLRIACQTINGVTLAPGGTFSYNATLGKRTPDKGYKIAPIIGGSGESYGGGICQVSSTLFNAVLLGNLEITERIQHSSAVSYVPRGMDATVNWGTKDFCFRNNSEYYVQIYAHMNGSTVTVSLMTREDISVADDVVVNVTKSGSTYTLSRYYQGIPNYTTTSRY